MAVLKLATRYIEKNLRRYFATKCKPQADIFFRSSMEFQKPVLIRGFLVGAQGLEPWTR
jgi:hypothetical protein